MWFNCHTFPINLIEFGFRIGSLELFLHQETRVDPEAVLAYLSDGRRLVNSNSRELMGSQDRVSIFNLSLLLFTARSYLLQSIFVFNKYYLDSDLDDVLRDLRVEAPLWPAIEGMRSKLNIPTK